MLRYGKKAEEGFVALGTVIKDSGLEESVVKVCGPDSTMAFLGIQFDTVKLTLSVTHERLVKIIPLLKKWELKSSATKKEGCYREAFCHTRILRDIIGMISIGRQQ